MSELAGAPLLFPSGEAIDLARMRSDRRARCLAEMKRAGIDALILGREANARYVSGAQRLWTTGLRPFAPGCVVVAETEQVHVLSTWEEGIPPEIGRTRIYGGSWNPVTLIERVARIPGLARARRIGMDALTPLWLGLLGGALPAAEVVDGRDVMRRARAIKTNEEIACIRAAIALAEAALLPVRAELRPGVSERFLMARFVEEAARLGITTLGLQGSFCVLPRDAGARAPFLRSIPEERAIEADDSIAVDMALLCLGYSGPVGRTWHCPAGGFDASRRERDLEQRWKDALAGFLEDLVAGREIRQVRAAWQRRGESDLGLPALHGLGLGVEPPFLDEASTDEDARLEEGMVLAVSTAVADREGGAYFGREVVLLSAHGREILSGSTREAAR